MSNIEIKVPIGGGYNSSAEIPVTPKMAYAGLYIIDQIFITEVIDYNLRNYQLRGKSRGEELVGSLSGPLRNNSPEEREASEIENHVLFTREHMAKDLTEFKKMYGAIWDNIEEIAKATLPADIYPADAYEKTDKDGDRGGWEERFGKLQLKYTSNCLLKTRQDCDSSQINIGGGYKSSNEVRALKGSKYGALNMHYKCRVNEFIDAVMSKVEYDKKIVEHPSYKALVDVVKAPFELLVAQGKTVEEIVHNLRELLADKEKDLGSLKNAISDHYWAKERAREEASYAAKYGTKNDTMQVSK